MKAPSLKTITLSLSLVGAALASVAAHALPIQWTDWTSSTGCYSGTPGACPFGASGTITSGSEIIGVTYSNAQGVGFFQDGVGGADGPGPNPEIDYWQNNRAGRDPATSPYTSAVVDNIPDGTDIIALRFSGSQTLTFSQRIANPVFSYVSLNGNGYAFDQDFEILSVGGVGGNDCGYWGCGTSSKSVVDIGGGVLEYRLEGTGEPHGTLRFLGEFDNVSWRSSSNEFWNGFTVGVQGTALQVSCQQDPNQAICQTSTPMPEPSAVALLALGIAAMRRRFS